MRRGKIVLTWGEKNAINIQERPEQTRRVGLAQIGKEEDVARQAIEKRLQAWKVVVTEDQVNAPNPQGMPMPKDKAVVAPREESIFIPTKFIPIQVALGRGPVCEERAKMITRPDLTPKGKVPLIGKVSTLVRLLKRSILSSTAVGRQNPPGDPQHTAHMSFLLNLEGSIETWIPQSVLVNAAPTQLAQPTVTTITTRAPGCLPSGPRQDQDAANAQKRAGTSSK
jgi:hypothetical protein